MTRGVSLNPEKRAAGATLAWLTHQVLNVGTMPLLLGAVTPGVLMPRTVTLVYLSLKLETEVQNNLNRTNKPHRGASL